MIASLGAFPQVHFSSWLTRDQDPTRSALERSSLSFARKTLQWSEELVLPTSVTLPPSSTSNTPSKSSFQFSDNSQAMSRMPSVSFALSLSSLLPSAWPRKRTQSIPLGLSLLLVRTNPGRLDFVSPRTSQDSLMLSDQISLTTTWSKLSIFCSMRMSQSQRLETPPFKVWLRVCNSLVTRRFATWYWRLFSPAMLMLRFHSRPVLPMLFARWPHTLERATQSKLSSQ